MSKNDLLRWDKLINMYKIATKWFSWTTITENGDESALESELWKD